MNPQSLKDAVALALKVGHVFVATADREGLPHIAAAGRIEATQSGEIAVSAWFCPATRTNLSVNSHVSLLVWDPEPDIGYQILGQARNVEDIAVMDGYSPSLETKEALPQVQSRVIVRVKAVLGFKHAPHMDLPVELS